jgi:predicted transglutaminase-like cysteine proteinase
MRLYLKTVGFAAIITWLSAASIASAAFYGLPRIQKFRSDRLTFDVPSLAPMAFTRFCLRYPSECRKPQPIFRPHRITMSATRWAELTDVNRTVNRTILPQANMNGVLAEEWLIAPNAGDCNDYAVTKRHELLARHWPARLLILAEVVVPSGDHHLVLVVRTNAGDLVLDNLNANIRQLSATRYAWVRAQSPENPKFWSAVGVSTSIAYSIVDQRPSSSGWPRYAVAAAREPNRRAAGSPM